MRRSIGLITLLMFIFVVSCSSGPEKWYRPGANAKDFEHDKVACEDAVLNTGTTGLSSKVYSFEGCMEGKGWTTLDSSTQ